MAPFSGAGLSAGRTTGARAGASAAVGLKSPPPVLPFGPTLHHTGCGCPYNWAAGCRLCDWGDSWVQQAHQSMAPQPGQAHLAPIRKLKVGFCIPHANVTGGLKMMLEQMRLLRERGHFVVAMTRSELADTAIPLWSDVQVDVDVVVRLDQRFRDCYDVDSCDAIVTGIFHQVPEWLTSTTAPVLYYEQGHEWLFGDPVRFQEAGSYAAQDNLFHMAMHLPVALAAVSEAVQSIICREFGRSCLLVHNGVNCQHFRPGPLESARLAAPSRVLGGVRGGQPARPDGRPLPSVLLVGNPGLSLKGFDVALSSLSLVNRSRPIQIHWVCQQEPPAELLSLIHTSGLTVSLHINPPQEALPLFYRGHDCFLFTSRYEAWGMPVLEAMASGLPVVASENAGVSSFATRQVDCLMAPAGDVAELAQHVLSVLEDASLASRLAAAARQTALRYTPARVVAQLERVLYSLTACRQELMALRLQSLPDSQMAAAAAVKACSGVADAHKAAVKARQQHAASAGSVAASAAGDWALPERRSSDSLTFGGSGASLALTLPEGGGGAPPRQAGGCSAAAWQVQAEPGECEQQQQHRQPLTDAQLAQADLRQQQQQQQQLEVRVRASLATEQWVQRAVHEGPASPGGQQGSSGRPSNEDQHEQQQQQGQGQQAPDQQHQQQQSYFQDHQQHEQEHEQQQQQSLYHQQQQQQQSPSPSQQQQQQQQGPQAPVFRSSYEDRVPPREQHHMGLRSIQSAPHLHGL